MEFAYLHHGLWQHDDATPHCLYDSAALAPSFHKKSLLCLIFYSFVTLYFINN